LVMALAVLATPAAAAAGDHVAHSTRAPELSAKIDGVRLSAATEPHPLKVVPGQQVTVSLQLRNTTGRSLDVRSVNLEGRIAGLTFFAFDTEVNFDVSKSKSKALSYVLDTTTLKGQATGLVPSSLVLLGPGGATIASTNFVTDVHGSVLSVYGLFGLGIVALTALALVEVLLALAHGRLPLNRWRRGTRFLAAGLGVGGIVVFSASALGKWLPSNAHWFTILAIAAVAGFGLGYLTPTPIPAAGPDDDDDDDEQIDGTPTNLAQLSELST
jgi:hypothetical protein